MTGRPESSLGCRSHQRGSLTSVARRPNGKALSPPAGPPQEAGVFEHAGPGLSCAPPTRHQLSAAACEAVAGLGEGRHVKTRCPLGQRLPGQWVPLKSGLRIPSVGRPPCGLCPLGPGGPSSSEPEAPRPFCEVLQAERAGFLIRRYRKDIGLGATPPPGRSCPPVTPALNGLVWGGQAPQSGRGSLSASCQDVPVTLAGEEHAVLGSPGCFFVSGQRWWTVVLATGPLPPKGVP